MAEREVESSTSGAPEHHQPSAVGSELLGRLLNDRFKVLSVLDHGGMGIIYRAEQVPLGRVVALKALLPSMLRLGDPTFRDRFFLEASTCARLRHPNTVTIYDFGEFEPGAFYIAMELLEGHSLHKLLGQQGRLDAARVLHIALQVCGSLSEAHANGIVHRDIKPANIYLIDQSGSADFVKVLDFGLVKELNPDATGLTQQGEMMGSPRYMSPEQIRASAIDGRSDIYSLGATLFVALTGQHAFEAPDSVSLLLAHVSQPPRTFAEVAPDLDVPPEVEALVMRCLAKRPEDRYADLGELMQAIRDIAPLVGLKVPEPTGRASDRSSSRLSTSVAVAPEEADATLGRAASVIMAEPARSSKAPLIGAGLALAAAAAGALFFMSSKAPEVQAPVPTVAAVAPEPPASTLAPAPAVAEGPALVQLTVGTSPEGATLFRDGVDLGDAPVQLLIPEGERWTLEARLDGYQSRSIEVVGGQTAVQITLKANPVARPGPARPASKAPQAAPRTGASGTDLKDPWSR